MRSAQATTSLPDVSQLATGTISACSSWPAPMEKKAIQESSALTASRLVVTSSEARGPICGPRRPAIRKPMSGRKTIRSYITSSALQRVDVFDRDRAAVAVIGDENGEADRRFGRRDGQDEQREHLAGE